MELFPEFEDKSSDSPPAPLADRMRPSDLNGLLGHVKLVGEGKPLRTLITRKSWIKSKSKTSITITIINIMIIIIC